MAVGSIIQVNFFLFVFYLQLLREYETILVVNLIPNFIDGALITRHSVTIYERKVDHLYELVLNTTNATSAAVVLCDNATVEAAKTAERQKRE